MRPILQLYGRHRSVVIRQNPLERLAQIEINVVIAQFLLERSSHFAVKQRQYLWLQFHHRHFKAHARKLLNHLQPDVAGADDDRFLPSHRAHRDMDRVRVFYISKSEYIGGVDAF